MLRNYLAIDGSELLFSDRTMDYIERYFKGVSVKCKRSGLHGILTNDTSFTTPSGDVAPWMVDGAVPHAANFLGGIVTNFVGFDDSTQVGVFTELKDEGAVHHSPHFSPREMKVNATLYARDPLALDFGIDWLKSAIDSSFCGTGFGANCNGSSILFLAADVSSEAEMTAALRQVLDVKVLSGVKVLGYPQFKGGLHAAEVEFILQAGSPFVFNNATTWSANMTDGTKTLSVAEQTCDPEVDAYSELVTDPLDGTLARPPRPPAINPLPMPATWQSRYTTLIPETVTDLWGQLVFKIAMKSSSTRRQSRIRIYPQSASAGGCNYSGEFYVTYIPANHTLHIDGRLKEIYLTPNSAPSKRIPAANLVLGSAGRPIDWPVVDCRTPHRVEFSSMGDDSTLTEATIKAYLRR